jgi:carboxylesterase type B
VSTELQVTPVLDLLPAAPDLAVSRSMAGWWAAFARGGPPDPAWPPARPEGYSYWVIDTQPGVREREELARLERWL